MYASFCLASQKIFYLMHFTLFWTSAKRLSVFVVGAHYEPANPPLALFFSVAFFTFAPLSLFAITCALWLNHKNAMAAFTAIVGIAAALPWLLLFAFNYAPNVAIPEFTSGLAVSVWAVMLGVKMLKETPQGELSP